MTPGDGVTITLFVLRVRGARGWSDGRRPSRRPCGQRRDRRRARAPSVLCRRGASRRFRRRPDGNEIELEERNSDSALRRPLTPTMMSPSSPERVSSGRDRFSGQSPRSTSLRQSATPQDARAAASSRRSGDDADAGQRRAARSIRLRTIRRRSTRSRIRRRRKSRWPKRMGGVHADEPAGTVRAAGRPVALDLSPHQSGMAPATRGAGCSAFAIERADDALR